MASKVWGMEEDMTEPEIRDGASSAWGVMGKVLLTIGPFALLAVLLMLHRWTS